LLRLIPHLLILRDLLDLHDCLLSGFIGDKDEQILRLAVFEEIDESNLLILHIFNFLSQKLKNMLPVVVAHNAVLV